MMNRKATHPSKEWVAGNLKEMNFVIELFAQLIVE